MKKYLRLNSIIVRLTYDRDAISFNKWHYFLSGIEYISLCGVYDTNELNGWESEQSVLHLTHISRMHNHFKLHSMTRMPIGVTKKESESVRRV